MTPLDRCNMTSTVFIKYPCLDHDQDLEENHPPWVSCSMLDEDQCRAILPRIFTSPSPCSI